MTLTTHKTKILSMCALLAASASGCDLISSVKEYFQDSPKKTIVKPASSPKTVPVEAQPEVSSVMMAGNVLARVGSWSVTTDEFDERLTALKEAIPEYDITDLEAKRLVLEELVNQQILVLDAEKTGLARQKDIESAVEEFRRTLIVREVARTLTENITMSDAEARAFYDENEEAMVGPAEWHVREIVMASKEQMTNVLTEVLKGADFQAMARQYSIGQTAAQGGDLGFITQEPFPQMGSVLLSLEEGDVSSVFKGPEGYYVVKLEEKRGGGQIDFDEIKEDIIQSQTLLKQQQTILDHLDNLKASMRVEINEELLSR